MALLSDKTLDTSVAIMIGAQQLAQLTKMMMQNGALPQSYVDRVSWTSLLLFDYEFIRPGCRIGRQPYSVVFFISLSVALFALLLFLIASLCRGVIIWISSVHTRHDAVSYAVSRIKRSVIILCSMVYLIVTTRVIQALYCVDVNGEMLLNVERSTVCYTEYHVYVSMVAMVMLPLYVMGFPLACGRVTLYNIVHKRPPSEPLGYLYRGLVPKCYWYRLTALMSSLVLVIVTVFSSSDAFRLGCAGLVFVVDLTLLMRYSPFKRRIVNTMTTITAMLKIVNVMTLCWMSGDSASMSLLYVFGFVLAIAISLSTVAVKPAHDDDDVKELDNMISNN